MRIIIAAMGRQRAGPEKTLFESYTKRLPWPTRLVEVTEPRGGTPGERKCREAERLLKAIPDRATVVALDEGGRALTSRAFARHIARWRDDGIQDLAFVIGGADGLDRTVIERAGTILSFGPMTWPHLLARVLLAEQLYRAHAILTGHPYHRN